ncbi:MAG: PGDYG domain-containing protein [Planctomycetaceae bacterium]
MKTLEGEEQVEAGHYLCRGEEGDIWPQTEKDLTRRYQAVDEVDADGWRKYQPNPDAEGAMAMQIHHPFSVKTSWGTLSGKPGDYLLKNWHDRDTAHPEDVLIVDQTLFQQTYESVVSVE